tara:strand:+ start:38004 stop:39470 length:1467 start_codon:yes stop_codon:yes gene_type:complete
MSEIVWIKKINDVHLYVHCEPSVAKELSTYFTFEVPGAKFMPTVRNRMWDGKIRLFSLRNNTIYVGLLPYIKEFLNQNGITYTIDDNLKHDPNVTEKNVIGFIKSLKIPLEYRDYQLQCIISALMKQRGLFVSPTASGKSYIIYVLVRFYYLVLLNGKKKILIIVPTTSLVEQMATDFVSYGWSQKKIHKIYSGYDKETHKPVVISTWQSLYKMPKKFFKDYKVIFGDEAHLFKAKSLTMIMEKLEDCPYRFGFTGTLDGTQTNRLVLEGLFGAAEHVTTTKELMDKDTIAKLSIDCLLLRHDEKVSKQMCSKDFSYNDEIDYLISHDKRNKFIRDLCKNVKGNVLCLYTRVEKHGERLLELFKDIGKEVYFVHGGVGTDDREQIRNIAEKKNNIVILASYGVFSTGINIRNLHNVVFASPYKSRIKVLQSIGRGLRRTEQKKGVKLFDIADDLSYKNKKNFTLLHFQERINIYNEEQFDYRIDRVNI